MKHKCKYTALHHEYEINRHHYDPDMFDGEDIGNAPGKRLGLINAASLIHYNDHLFPHIDGLTTTDFPEQDTTKLGTVYPLWYMDQHVHEKTYCEFTVVRWDNVDPYRVMLVNDANKILLVTEAEYVEAQDGVEETDEKNRVVNNSTIHLWPKQMDELQGVMTRDMYLGETTYIDGIILRADSTDNGNPQYVILEEVDEETYRLVTFEETKPIINLYDVKEKAETDFYWPSDWRNLVENEDSTSGESE